MAPACRYRAAALSHNPPCSAWLARRLTCSARRSGAICSMTETRRACSARPLVRQRAIRHLAWSRSNRQRDLVHGEDRCLKPPPMSLLDGTPASRSGSPGAAGNAPDVIGDSIPAAYHEQQHAHGAEKGAGRPSAPRPLPLVKDAPPPGGASALLSWRCARSTRW